MTQNGPGSTINAEDTSDRYGNHTKRKPIFSVTHSASFNAIEPLGKENKTVK
jgi:hypothetical protein